ncbi:hypothetical protein FNV43_RR16915 [Rhamnella rubrinervis]|uniref:NB-ARC domain-containing protein n=1 Tax=Rhamnella rubrinervis TaxID=2594499 RepID=A0A8K0GZM7_9ROSA|nr:hypothetical protein FNV43_RR16915 [Rhamnella rubrinervis]
MEGMDSVEGFLFGANLFYAIWKARCGSLKQRHIWKLWNLGGKWNGKADAKEVARIINSRANLRWYSYHLLCETPMFHSGRLASELEEAKRQCFSDLVAKFSLLNNRVFSIDEFSLMELPPCILDQIVHGGAFLSVTHFGSSFVLMQSTFFQKSTHNNTNLIIRSSQLKQNGYHYVDHIKNRRTLGGTYGRQLGYLIFYQGNVRVLAGEKVKDKRAGIQRCEHKHNVLKWMVPDFKQRYSLGRKAMKSIEVVLKLLQEGNFGKRWQKVARRAKEEKLFSEVAIAIASQTPNDIGIPNKSEHLRCTILLTSRREEACSQMESQKTFTIEVLSEDEGWNLFEEVAGTSINTSYLHPIAEQIVRKDYDIPIETLVRYGKGLRLFQGVDTMAEERSRVHSLVQTLKRCFLLTDNDKLLECVTLHDAVRDVAVSIASRKENGFVENLVMRGCPNFETFVREASTAGTANKLKQVKDEDLLPPDRENWRGDLNATIHHNFLLKKTDDYESRYMPKVLCVKADDEKKQQVHT